jgi:hypothetical protein
VKTYRSEILGQHRFWDEELGEWGNAQTPEEIAFVERAREALKNSMVEKTETND